MIPGVKVSNVDLMRRALAALVVFTANLGWAQEKAPASRPPGLDAKVPFKIEAGPLLSTLQGIERQTGLSFSVVPEFLPPEIKAGALTHAGTVGEGLDKVLSPLGLRWSVGELGGIVILPKDFKFKDGPTWVEKNFTEDEGVEVIEAGERAQQLGLKNGDVLIAMEGERRRSISDFYKACLELPENPEVTFTVKRGKETLQVKARLPDRGRWASYGLGLTRFDDAPSDWTIYQKGGHRDPKWDDLFSKLVEEARLDLDKKDPAKILAAARECAKAGCRDPRLVQIVTHQVNEFSAGLWREVRGWADSARLRGDYGGSMQLVRVYLAAAFLEQGPPAVRDECRRFVEVGWEVFKGGPMWRARRAFAYSLANLHFVEGRFEDAARLMKTVQEQYIKDWDAREVKLHTQALCRLGRFGEALKEHDLYSTGERDGYYQTYVRLVSDTQAGLQDRKERPPERFTGPAGVVGWKTLSALDALVAVSGGGTPSGGRRMEDMKGRSFFGYLVDPEPFHDDFEFHLFARAIKEYAKGGSKIGAVFGAQPKPPRPETNLKQHDLYSGCQYTVIPDFKLWRYHAGIAATTPLPLPGFLNDGTDDLRIFKSGNVVTVRANDAWVTTDVTPANQVRGACILHINSIKGVVDAGVLIPTKRSYDNDRIRELMERIFDPREKLSAEERLKLWDEATILAPPKSMMKDLRRWVPDGLRNKVPAPAYPSDAAPLAELTVEQAVARFTGRGPVRWTKPDPDDKDSVWCARTDGVLEVMSRMRYWTTRFRYVPDFTGQDVAVGEPLFQKDAIWFPTPQGLFRYDRKGEVFRRVPVAGVFNAVGVSSVALKGGSLSVVTSSAKWLLDLKTGRWVRD